VAWAGSPTHKGDHHRSIALRAFLRAIPPEVCCYSLQKELREGDREVLRERSDVVHLGDDLADLADTAAALSQLDLLVCADTSVAHLAGALGKPVWVLLPFAPD
jgi:hypothetical protein